MSWSLINIISFVGTPVGLLYGWVTYRKQTGVELNRRTRMSLVGLLAATFSVVLLVVSLFLPMAAERLHRLLVRAGVLTPILGMLLSIAGRRRLLPPIILSSVGAVLLWYGLSVQ